MEHDKKKNELYEWNFYEMNLKQCLSFTVYYDVGFIYSLIELVSAWILFKPHHLICSVKTL